MTLEDEEATVHAISVKFEESSGLWQVRDSNYDGYWALYHSKQVQVWLEPMEEIRILTVACM